MRFGLGPVFIYECLANSRRWQTYALRSVGVATLLAAMGVVATSRIPTDRTSWRAYAALGQSYFVTLIGVELAVVMLAAPAATAGTICVDRARGTLAHMLMTDLSDSEIVLGKLAARLVPVFGLVACTWPVLALCSLLGGIDPIALTMAFAIIVAVAVLGCTIALTLSVWARKSHEVILATYTVFIAGVTFWPIWSLVSMARWIGRPPHWTLLFNPFYMAFAPYADPAQLTGWDYLAFFGVAITASALFVALAVWRMRPVACRGIVEIRKRPRIGWIGRLGRWLPGPSLDQSPVLWREWHRSRPSLWMMAILALLMGTTGALCLVGAVFIGKNGLSYSPSSVWELAGVFSYMLHVFFGLLMLAAVAPTSMAEERQRGSLDILAATALSTREIVVGKWLGTFRLVVIMVVAPGLLTLAMAIAHPSSPPAGMPPGFDRTIPIAARCFGVAVVIATILAHGALCTSVGLALAVWIKRQSRAIASSVASFLVVTAAWPFFVSTIMGPQNSRLLMSVSPVMICAILVNLLTSRYHGPGFEGVLWSGTICAVEVFVVAMSILWLTVRTFDSCFDRIADRSGRISHNFSAIVILTAMIGAGSCAGAIDHWIEGVTPWVRGTTTPLGITAYIMAIATVLVLIADETARPRRLPWVIADDQRPQTAAWTIFLGRWWGSFRLVLLLTVGPAVVALALATAHKAPSFEPQLTKNAAGVMVVTSYVAANTDIPAYGASQLGQRLIVAAALVTTLLAHGAAAVSIGLGLAVVIGWSRRAFMLIGGLALALVLIVPIYLSVFDSRDPLAVDMWSFAMAASTLLTALVARTASGLTETIQAILFWDLAAIIFSLGLSWWTVWAWQRRRNGEAKSEPVPSTELQGG